MSVYVAREAKNLPGAYENQPRWRSRNGSPAAVKRRRATLASAQVELPRTKHRQLTRNLLDSDADQTPTAWFVDDFDWDSGVERDPQNIVLQHPHMRCVAPRRVRVAGRCGQENDDA